MNQRFFGSICLSDLVDLAKQKHSAFTKADNGKIYGNVTVWLNEDPDQYGNVMSMQLNPRMEYKEQDGQPYFGNCKKAEPKPINDRDTNNLSLPGDIPARQSFQQPNNSGWTPINETPVNDLPFD